MKVRRRVLPGCPGRGEERETGREFDLQELGVRRSGVAEFDRVFA